MIPDLRGCPEHGPDEWRLYKYKNGRTERRCLACQRNKQAATHYNGPSCHRGHLKTPWTWRRYGPSRFGRCLPCQYERQKLA